MPAGFRGGFAYGPADSYDYDEHHAFLSAYSGAQSDWILGTNVGHLALVYHGDLQLARGAWCACVDRVMERVARHTAAAPSTLFGLVYSAPSWGRRVFRDAGMAAWGEAHDRRLAAYAGTDDFGKILAQSFSASAWRCETGQCYYFGLMAVNMRCMRFLLNPRSGGEDVTVLRAALPPPASPTRAANPRPAWNGNRTDVAALAPAPSRVTASPVVSA